MIANINKKLVIVAIIAVFASGCRSTKEYRKFAEAGNEFVVATNSLLETASDLTIDTTSERVLRTRQVNIRSNPAQAGKDTLNTYNTFSEQDKVRLELINELSKHNKLLQDYFNKLIELADSKSPENTQNAINGIVTQLEGSGIKLIKFPGIQIQLPPITKIVLDARIRGALREELEKRKDTIYREITIQEKLLKEIGDIMQRDVEELQKLQEERLVIKPLIQEGDIDENQWIETRKEILTGDMEVISAIQKASNNSKEFKEIFLDSIEGEVTSKRLKKFIQETNSFSALVNNNQ